MDPVRGVMAAVVARQINLATIMTGLVVSIMGKIIFSDAVSDRYGQSPFSGVWRLPRFVFIQRVWVGVAQYAAADSGGDSAVGGLCGSTDLFYQPDDGKKGKRDVLLVCGAFAADDFAVGRDRYGSQDSIFFLWNLKRFSCAPWHVACSMA